MKQRITTPAFQINFTPQVSSRREFIRGIAGILGSASIIQAFTSDLFADEDNPALKPRAKRVVRTACDLAVAKGSPPALITRKAVEALGGMGLFVKQGDTVVVKPNIAWDRSPAQAANTHPDVVAEIVRLCYAAGARTVKVFDRTCNDPAMCYRTSGIAAAAEKAGGRVSHTSDWKFIPAAFPEGSAMGTWKLYRDAVECDVFINVPVAKHHSLTRLTLSMKNLMGVCGGLRGQIHWNIDEKLADLTAFIAPNLTIIDATRILLRNGPSGGRIADVKETRTVIAGTDPVLADAYAATLFGLQPRDIDHIKTAEARGIGSAEISSANIRRIAL